MSLTRYVQSSPSRATVSKHTVHKTQKPQPPGWRYPINALVKSPDNRALAWLGRIIKTMGNELQQTINLSYPTRLCHNVKQLTQSNNKSRQPCCEQTTNQCKLRCVKSLKANKQESIVITNNRTYT